jgi:hypothetical protein
VDGFASVQHRHFVCVANCNQRFHICHSVVPAALIFAAQNQLRGAWLPLASCSSIALKRI